MLGYSPFMHLPFTFWATILCQVMPGDALDTWGVSL